MPEPEPEPKAIQESIPEPAKRPAPVPKKKPSWLLYGIIALLVAAIIGFLVYYLISVNGDKKDNPEQYQSPVVENIDTTEKPVVSENTVMTENLEMTVPELLDSIKNMLPAVHGKLVASFPDDSRRCLYYLANKKLFCYDADENMSASIPIKQDGYRMDVLSATLMSDGYSILIQAKDIEGRRYDVILDTNENKIVRKKLSSK